MTLEMVEIGIVGEAWIRKASRAFLTFPFKFIFIYKVFSRSPPKAFEFNKSFSKLGV
jgi:hypothetical protein